MTSAFCTQYIITLIGPFICYSVGIKYLFTTGIHECPPLSHMIQNLKCRTLA